MLPSIIIERDLALKYVGYDLIIVVTLERRVTAQDNVKDASG